MSREDDLRALREARFTAKAKRPLGAAQLDPAAGIATKPVTKISKPVTKIKVGRGRPRIGDRAMTAAERQRRRRARPQPGGENG
jgi:hypothetical protein